MKYCFHCWCIGMSFEVNDTSENISLYVYNFFIVCVCCGEGGFICLGSNFFFRSEFVLSMHSI
jgi:hypothetical protein